MLTGFNSDIEFHGRVFHVQTQEKGLADPVVESLVYCGGLVVTLVRFSYATLIDTPRYSDDAVLQLMEYQHRRMIRDIRNGKFASSPESSSAQGHVDEKSLDEVVLDYLERSLDEPRMVELAIEHRVRPNAGDPATPDSAFDDDAQRSEESPSGAEKSLPGRAEQDSAERRVLERLERFLDAVQREPSVKPEGDHRTRCEGRLRTAVSADGVVASVSVRLPAEPSVSAARIPARRRGPRHRAAVWIVVAAAAALGVVLWISPPLEVSNHDIPVAPGRRGAGPVASPSNTPPPDDAIETSATPGLGGAKDGTTAESTGGPSPNDAVVAPGTDVAGTVPSPAMRAERVVLEENSPATRPEPHRIPDTPATVAPRTSSDQATTTAGRPVTKTDPVGDPSAPPVEADERAAWTESTAKPEPRAADIASLAVPPAAKLEEPRPDEPAQPLRVDWTGKLVDIAAVDTPPQPTQRDLPRYTSRARRLRQQGVVGLELLISEHGRVLDARTVRAIPDSDLDQAALAAARDWRFTPATKAGFPVRVWKPVELEFSISSRSATKIRIRD
jgi:TonB family protein